MTGTYDAAGHLATANDGTTRTYGYDAQSNRNAAAVEDLLLERQR